MVVFIIFFVCISFFIFYQLCKGQYGRAEAISTFGTMLVAGVAAGFAYNQLNESKLSSAKGLYKDYILLAFQNPDFSAASYPLGSPRFDTIELDSEKYEKYENFVAFLLFSAEEILELGVSGEGWCRTLRDQFKYHALYLGGASINTQQYSSVLSKLINEGIELYHIERKEDSVGVDAADIKRRSALTKECRVI